MSSEFEELAERAKKIATNLETRGGDSAPWESVSALSRLLAELCERLEAEAAIRKKHPQATHSQVEQLLEAKRQRNERPQPRPESWNGQ